MLRGKVRRGEDDGEGVVMWWLEGGDVSSEVGRVEGDATMVVVLVGSWMVKTGWRVWLGEMWRWWMVVGGLRGLRKKRRESKYKVGKEKGRGDIWWMGGSLGYYI